MLVEGPSRRSDEQFSGRTDTNKMVVFDRESFLIGDYVDVRITGCTSATLKGEAVAESGTNVRTVSESAGISEQRLPVVS